MSRSTVANLVARLDADTARFQRQMQQANLQTQRYQRQSQAANDGSIRMADGFQRAANAASVLQGPLNGVSGRLSFIASGMRMVGPAGLALGVGIAAMTTGIFKAVGASENYIRSQAKLEAQVKTTGNSVGLTTQQLLRMSEEVASSTLASSEGIRQAQGQLLRFTSVTGDEFGRAIRLAQDYVAVTGGDVAGAAERLGRILEEPREAFSRLRREGIHLSQTQRELITTLMETGQTAKAQGIILSELESRFGGVGTAENIGLTGATDSFGQTWDQMLREISLTESVVRAASGSLGYLEGVVKRVRDGMAGTDGAMRYMDESDLFQARFDADAAVQEMERERNEITQRIQELLDGRDYFDLSNLSPTKFRVDKLQGDVMLLRQAQQEQMRLSEMYNAEILKRQEEAAEAQAAAEVAAEERRQVQEADAAAKRAEEQQKELTRQQAHSLKLIEAMEMQYADEEQKLEIAHARQLASIENLYADKEALERMGYESLEALRAEYRQLEVESFQQQLIELAAQEEKKRQVEIGAANARIQTIERSLASEQELLALRRDDRIAELEELHERELLETERFLELKEALHTDHDARLKQMQAMQLSVTLGNYSDLFDGISGLSEMFAGKQSSLYKTMFAASKGFAIADSTVQIINGIAKAAALPFPVNLGAMATVGSATTGLVSSIRGTQLAGARANGGPVSRGLYLVGERGPEVLDINGGRGQITSNENLRSALGGGGQGMHMEQHYHFEALDHEQALDLFARERGALTDSIIRELEDRGISL